MMIEKVNNIIKEMSVLEEDLKGMIVRDETRQAFESYLNLVKANNGLIIYAATIMDTMNHKIDIINEELDEVLKQD